MGWVGGWVGGTDSDYRANLSSTETAVELQLELSLAKIVHHTAHYGIIELGEIVTFLATPEAQYH